ncbi:MAG TPA: M13 family metallopeptidase [Terriglobales bacterium]|nr:M13 family metallopeptidase [Terriglobales bacterium]
MRPLSALAVALLLCAFSAAQTVAAPASSDPAAMPPLEHFSPGQIDKTLDPCTDFFQYACHKWNEANPIPADQAAWGTFNLLAIWNVAAVHHTLEQAAHATNRTPVEQKAGDYYAACMNETAINRVGLTPLRPALERIDNLKEKSQLPALIAYLHLMIRPANLVFIDAQYNGLLFGLYGEPDFSDAGLTLAALDQSGMGLPGREFYLNDDGKSKQIRAKYVEYVARMLELSGEPHTQAAADASSVLSFETALAKAAMDIVARRDPKNQNNKMTLEQVQALTPSFNWSHYLAAMNAPPSPQYLVLAPDFFRGMEQLVEDEPVEHWKAYLRAGTLRFMAPFLSQPLVDESFDFYGRTLAGATKIQPRWRRCSINADTDLGEAVGQAYVAKYFPASSKERMLQIVKAIETALGEDIDSASWMSAATKQAAHVKLAAQIDKIGYPDRWRDYSALEIKRDDFLGNVERAARFELQRRMATFGKPTNRYDWNMTPPTVNAYEDPQSNTINFPAGILQPPFFDAAQSDAANYGAIGAVIGHEITHGYDDQGRKFDAQGNLRDWWTAQDAANYDQRDECITDEYTQEVPEAGVKQNGKLSAGEDTADNGGIHLTLAALQKTLKAQGKALDSPEGNGLTELQTFFLSYANVWCGELRPELAHTAVLSQGHSLDRYRVNNVVANMPEFAHAFGCHAGQPMVHAKQCRVW